MTMQNEQRRKPYSVLVIDDSAVVRQSIQKILDEDPDLEVVAVASDPLVAAERIRKQIPDVITLDVEMPRMDGITFLRRLMAQRPIPVVVCSTLVGERTETLVQALDAGAVDIVLKPELGVKQFFDENCARFRDTIKAAAQARLSAMRSPRSVAKKLPPDVVLPPPGSLAMARTTERIVAIGASTGGTEALRVILEDLPPDCAPIVVVQHMPEGFTAAFARRLNGLCAVTVKEAQNGDRLLRGHVLIAPGNKHTLLMRSGAHYSLEVKDGPLVSRHRPSVDVLFRSVARKAGSNALGVIMTGMGDDGAIGLKEMREAGAVTIAQDEASCVVYGMPKEALNRGAVEKEVSLENLAREILSTVESRASKTVK